MNFNCPTCGHLVKLSLSEIQKPVNTVECPSCKVAIALKNNLPVKK